MPNNISLLLWGLYFELFALYVILRAWKNGALYIEGVHYTVCLGEWKFSSVILGFTDWGKKLDSKLISCPWYYMNANPCLENKPYFFTLILKQRLYITALTGDFYNFIIQYAQGTM